MIIQVKYGLIRLINQKTDLCEQVSNVDLECPIKKGKIVITKDVTLPKEIPPVCAPFIWCRCWLWLLTMVQGNYGVFADAYTADDKKIVCVESTIRFS